MKKVLCTVLALAMALALLAGCGGAPASSGSTAASGSARNAENATIKVAALVSGFAIIPAVFAFGLDPTSGPPLMFITLPRVFAQMPLGSLFAALFFASVLFAGVTSLVNMFEVCAEAVTTHLHLPRKGAIALVAAVVFGAGLFLEYEPWMSSWMDFITIGVVPFGALLGAVMIYWLLPGKTIRAQLEQGRKRALPRWFLPVAKWLYIPLTALVFVLGLKLGGIG